MRFIAFFTERRVLTTMLFTGLVVLGIVSLFNIPYSLLPEVSNPVLTIVTDYRGATPEIVEREVTIPVEQGVAGVRGVMDVRSISRDGRSIVSVFFHRRTDMKSALLHMRERMDQVYWSLPDGCAKPVILTVGPSSRPIMSIWVKGDRNFVNRIVKRRIEQIDGVGEVRLTGVRKGEIVIRVDGELLNTLGIGIDEIINIIRANNISIPAGKIREGNYAFPMRFVVSAENKEKILNLPLKKGRFHIRDVAVVEEGYERETSTAFYNGRKGYIIQVFKEWDANTIKVSRNVKRLIDKLKERHKGLEFAIAEDDAEFIISSIMGIIVSLVLGGILAFLALFLFTGNKRIPFILSLSMPLSIIPSFFFMFISGVSINTMTLGGLALGIGMLVDASIVVLENIIKRGDPVKGASEVGIAVLTSILTTIAVFFPLFYIKGLAGDMLKPLAYAVIITLLLSLFVAFTLLPLLSKGAEERETNIYKKFREGYRRFIRVAYGKKGNVYFVSLLFLIVSALITFVLKREAIPEISTETVVRFTLPPGTPIEQTISVGERLSSFLTENGCSVLFIAGETDPFGMTGEESGILRIKGRVRKEIFNEVFKYYRDIEFLIEDYNPVLADFTNIGKVYLRAYYQDESERKMIYNEMKNKLKNARFTLEEEIPVVQIEPEPVLLSALSLTPEDILKSIEMNTDGIKITDVHKGEEKITILLKGERKKIKDLRIKGYPISFLCKVKNTYVKQGIVRFNGRRCVEASISGMEVENLGFSFPVEPGGEIEEFRKARNSTIFAGLIAVFLVYLILASFYESFLLPFLILIAVPFAGGGFIFSLFLTGTSLNAISLLGLVVLIGIVVNDAIVLLDRAEAIRKKGEEYPGRKAAEGRLRPIVMTTITTVLGLLPFSTGNTLHAPMGRGIIGGLLLSTFITLLLIPMIYDRIFS